MKYVFTIFAALILSACGSNATKQKVASIDAGNKQIVILGNTPYNADIRMALLGQGFKVKVQSTTHRITQKSESTDISFNQAAATYGLTFSWATGDRCIFNDGVNLWLNAELVDLRTNETVMFIRRNGWTNSCYGGERGEVFNALAKDLADSWN